MARRPFDPLELLPSADAIRGKLQETETLATRLRLLLDFVIRLERPAASIAPAGDTDRVRGERTGGLS